MADETTNPANPAARPAAHPPLPEGHTIDDVDVGTGRSKITGQFIKGWPRGPDNMPPHASKMRRFRQIVLDAVSDEQLQELTFVLIQKAAAGDMGAAGLLLDRILGKAKPEPDYHPLPIDLPPTLQSAADIAAAARAILDAVASGALPANDAQKLGTIIETARRTYETQGLEERLAKLEELASAQRGA